MNIFIYNEMPRPPACQLTAPVMRNNESNWSGFSKAGELISVRRSRLKPKNVDMFLFLNKYEEEELDS